MKIMKKLLLMTFTVISTFAMAQKMKIVSGNFDFLKDQTEVNVELIFDKNVIFQAENLTEVQYLENRKNDVLANPKKTNEDWEKWNNEWKSFKEATYLQKFLKGINHKSKNIVFKSDLHSKYKLVVKTIWIYAGWSGGFIMQPAKLTSELRFVETNNPSNILLTLDSSGIEGVGISENPNSEYIMEYGRISVAYEKTGRLLSKEITRGIK